MLGSFSIIQGIITIAIYFVEFLLLLRFILKFLSVSSFSPFVSWVYSSTDSLISPFLGILPDFKVDIFVIEFSTLIALVVYILVGKLIIEVFGVLSNTFEKKDKNRV